MSTWHIVSLVSLALSIASAAVTLYFMTIR